MTDPDTLTRAQELRRDLLEWARRMGLRRFWRAPPKPSNLRTLATDPARIRDDADYGLHCGRHYRSRLEAMGVDLREARVLEIGPGTGFGGMAYLATRGARVGVADRWLSPWRPDYHPAYYGALADRIEAEEPDADVAPIRALIANQGYDGGAVALHREAAEALRSIADGTLTAAVSNAVLEHFSDPGAALRELARITRSGGVGVHQVDFRDHRDLDRPLEHLLFEPAVFRRLNERANTEYGSQLRRRDYDALILDAGFAIEAYEANSRADDAYLDELEPRLRRARRSVYADRPRAELAELGGLYMLRRTG